MSERPPDHTTEVQQLFVQHAASVKYFVLSLLPHPGEAEDVVQEVFLAVTAKANQYEPGTNFRAWAFAIARFKVLEFLKRRKKQPVHLSDETMALLAAEASEVTDADDLLAEQQLGKALAECVEELPPRARQLVELVYKGGMKSGAVAEEIGWTANAVYVGLSRVRGTLRQCIEKRLQPGVLG